MSLSVTHMNHPSEYTFVVKASLNSDKDELLECIYRWWPYKIDGISVMGGCDTACPSSKEYVFDDIYVWINN